MEYTYSIIKDDYANAGKVSSQIKKMLKELQVDPEVLRRMAIACYEAEINMIIHSYGGIIKLTIDDKVRFVFADTGPGIPDIALALQPGYSTADEKARELGFGAGMGLPNIKRVSDEFNIASSEKGTILTLGFKVL
ncbi:Anti-sigma F factor [bioreactor metagenome]|uniref:Anti-sigma F factor n=1 Tax=bioreactor metagenome TaxID=1076179 RepID=A0A645IM90_9ZZZZ|nr:ATP-binding protein [Erysipelotrichaceae bacterium]